MTDTMIKIKIADNDYPPVLNLVMNCIRSRIPYLPYKDCIDWKQDIALFITVNKYAIIACDNSLSYIIHCFYNKIKNCYAKKQKENNSDLITPSKIFPYENVAEKALSKTRNNIDNKIDKMIYDYITCGDISIRDSALQFISKSDFYRKKKTLEDVIKSDLKKELWIWGEKY